MAGAELWWAGTPCAQAQPHCVPQVEGPGLCPS